MFQTLSSQKIEASFSTGAAALSELVFHAARASSTLGNLFSKPAVTNIEGVLDAVNHLIEISGNFKMFRFF